MTMKYIITIIVLLCLSALIVHPVSAADTAAENTTPQDAATAYYNAGIKLLSTNEYSRAIEQFNLALASNTTLISKSDTLTYLYQAKAFAQIQLKEYDQALDTANIGLAHESKDEKLWNNKGFALHNLGRYQEAVNAYNQAIVYDSNYTSALINKGSALYKLGDYSGSAAAYSRALETDPGNADATEGLKHAQENAGFNSTVIIVLLAIAVIAAAGAILYVKTRKPAEEDKPAGKKGKDKEKGKKK